MPDLFNFVGTGPLLAVVLIVVVALLIFYVASRYRVANANEALIVAGSRGSKVRDERGEVAAQPPRLPTRASGSSWVAARSCCRSSTRSVGSS